MAPSIRAAAICVLASASVSCLAADAEKKTEAAPTVALEEKDKAAAPSGSAAPTAPPHAILESGHYGEIGVIGVGAGVEAKATASVRARAQRRSCSIRRRSRRRSSIPTRAMRRRIAREMPALAAFDAALDHGALPAATKDLVGDFAGKYAPSMTTPKTEGMTFAIDLERTAIAPAGGDVHLRDRDEGRRRKARRREPRALGDRARTARRPCGPRHQRLDAGLLDHPGEKGGRDLGQQARTRRSLLDDHVLEQRARDRPRRSHRTAKDRGHRHDPHHPGRRRHQHLLRSRSRVREAQKPGSPEGAVKVVMLLSDGHANGGDTNPKTLSLRAARAFQEGVQTSTFGIGTDFDANLMSTIADRGAGGYYYLADAAQIAPSLEKELEARLQPVAQALEIRVRLRNDVTATKVYGSQALDDDLAALVRAQEIAVDNQVKKAAGIAKDRDDDSKGGMRFFIPAFARGDRHAMLLSVHLPAGSAKRTIASVEIKYKDRVSKKNVTREIPVEITYAASEAASALTIVSSVAGTVQAFSAGDAIVRAAQMVDRGDRAGAAALLRERAILLRKVGSDAAFEADAVRIDRLADAVVGPQEVQDPMVLAVLLRGSSSGYLR